MQVEKESDVFEVWLRSALFAAVYEYKKSCERERLVRAAANERRAEARKVVGQQQPIRKRLPLMSGGGRAPFKWRWRLIAVDTDGRPLKPAAKAKPKFEGWLIGVGAQSPQGSPSCGERFLWIERCCKKKKKAKKNASADCVQ